MQQSSTLYYGDSTSSGGDNLKFNTDKCMFWYTESYKKYNKMYTTEYPTIYQFFI